MSESSLLLDSSEGKCAFFGRAEPDKLYIDGVLIPL